MQSLSIMHAEITLGKHVIYFMVYGNYAINGKAFTAIYRKILILLFPCNVTSSHYFHICGSHGNCQRFSAWFFSCVKSSSRDKSAFISTMSPMSLQGSQHFLGPSCPVDFQNLCCPVHLSGCLGFNCHYQDCQCCPLL
jgi:hypothetical protein